VQTQNVSTEGEEGYFTTISSREIIEGVLPEMSIQTHSQLVDMFSDSSDEVRVVSYIYYNISELFPSGRRGQNK
jgi:hypothetical protein